jgi:hypothetical protein
MPVEEVKKQGYTLITDPDQFKKDFPSVPYEKGMTTERAVAIKELQNDQARRDFYMHKRPITAFLGQLAGSIPAPENFVPVFGELGMGVKAGLAGRAAIAGAREAAEAVVGTTVFNIASMKERAALGQDTSWKAFAQDVALSAIIGAGFGSAFSLVGGLSPENNQTLNNVANNPENKTSANVVMNDALGSFLGSFPNTVSMGPVSFTYISQIANIPAENVRYSWDHMDITQAQNAQAFVTANIMSDPGMDWLKGTAVAMPNGQPRVVFTGSVEPLVPKTRMELPNRTFGIIAGKEAEAEANVKINPDVWDQPVNPREYDGPLTSAMMIGGKIFIGTEHIDALRNAIKYFGGENSPEIRAFEENPDAAIGTLDDAGFVNTGEGERGSEFQEHIDYARESGKEVNEAGSYSSVERSGIWFSDNPVHANRYAELMQAIKPETKSGAITPAMIDMRKPLVVKSKKAPTRFEKWQAFNEAKNSKEGYDGLIFEIADDGNGNPTKLYATWNPDNIINIGDAAVGRMKKLQEERMAAFNTSANAKINDVYGPSKTQTGTPEAVSYSQGVAAQNYAPNIRISADTGAVNLSALAREMDYTKYVDGAAKAEGIDIETGTNDFQSTYEAKMAGKELDAAGQAEMDAAEAAIAKANVIEDVMMFAVGCKDG